MKVRIYNKGVTLIELLLSTTIMAIVLLIVTGLHMYGIKAYKHDDITWQLQQDARYAVQQVLKEARKRPVSVDAGMLVINKNQYEDIVICCRHSANASGLYRQEVNRVTGAVTGENKIAENILGFRALPYDEGYIEIKVTAQKAGSDTVYSLSSGFYSRSISIS